MTDQFPFYAFLCRLSCELLNHLWVGHKCILIYFKNSLDIFQDPNNTAPVTLKVDRNGFFIFWYSDQKKVRVSLPR